MNPLRINKAEVAQEYSSRVETYNVPSMATSREGESKLSALIRRRDMVIDVGCGPGFALPMALRLVGKGGIVLAIDISIDMLKQAKRNMTSWSFPHPKFYMPNAKIRGLNGPRESLGKAFFILCDAEMLPIKDERVNVAFAFESLHRMDAEVALKEMWRVTRPGGYIFFAIPGAHDEDSMVFEHIPSSYLPNRLPKGFPPDFKLDSEYWNEEQRSWREFKAFCQERIPWLAEAMSKGWFYGYDSLRTKFNEYRSRGITRDDLERFIREWETSNQEGKLGWICFPTLRGFTDIISGLEKLGAIVIESKTSSFKPGVTRLLRTRERYYELYVSIFSQLIRSHTAILGKPPWSGEGR